MVECGAPVLDLTGANLLAQQVGLLDADQVARLRTNYVGGPPEVATTVGLIDEGRRIAPVTGGVAVGSPIRVRVAVSAPRVGPIHCGRRAGAGVADVRLVGRRAVPRIAGVKAVLCLALGEGTRQQDRRRAEPRHSSRVHGYPLQGETTPSAPFYPLWARQCTCHAGGACATCSYPEIME